MTVNMDNSWRSAYVTAELNKMGVDIRPVGIYRGFGVIPGANLNVDLTTDGGRATAVAEVNGYNLSLRSSSVITLPVTPSTTKQYVVLRALYQIGLASTAEALVVDEIQAGDLILATLNVPLGASDVLSSMISYEDRQDARYRKDNEIQRQVLLDTWGRQAFRDKSFLIELSGGDYTIRGGSAYVAGIQIEWPQLSVFDHVLPSNVWLDVSPPRTPDAESMVTIVVSADDQTDYIDSDGIPHYLEKIASLSSSGGITDLRSTFDSSKPIAAGGITDGGIADWGAWDGSGDGVAVNFYASYSRIGAGAGRVLAPIGDNRYLAASPLAGGTIFEVLGTYGVQVSEGGMNTRNSTNQNPGGYGQLVSMGNNVAMYIYQSVKAMWVQLVTVEQNHVVATDALLLTDSLYEVNTFTLARVDDNTAVLVYSKSRDGFTARILTHDGTTITEHDPYNYSMTHRCISLNATIDVIGNKVIVPIYPEGLSLAVLDLDLAGNTVSLAAVDNSVNSSSGSHLTQMHARWISPTEFVVVQQRYTQTYYFLLVGTYDGSSEVKMSSVSGLDGGWTSSGQDSGAAVEVMAPDEIVIIYNSLDAGVLAKQVKIISGNAFYGDRVDIDATARLDQTAVDIKRIEGGRAICTWRNESGNQAKIINAEVA